VLQRNTRGPICALSQASQAISILKQLILLECHAANFTHPTAYDIIGLDAFGTTGNYYELLRSHFLEKYRGKETGVIVSHTSRAMPYALRLRDELWPGTLAGIQDWAAALLAFRPK
jgi:hypothetical protein